MKDDLTSSFQTPQFKSLLARYENMLEQHTTAYFDSEELAEIAEYYASQGDADAADRVVDYGLKLHPDDLDLNIYKGNSLAIQGKFDEAHLILDSLADATDSEALLLRALLYLEQKQFEKAQDIFDDIIRKGEEDILSLMLSFSSVCAEAQQKELALQWAERAYKQCPDEKIVLETLVDRYAELDMWEKVPHILEILIDKDPYCFIYWLNLTRSYIRLGKFEKALEAVDFALVINENDTVAIELKGTILLMLCNFEEGSKWLEKVVDISPSERKSIQVGLANCFFLNGNLSKCIEYCNKVIDNPEASPRELAMIYHRRAVAYLKLGNQEQCWEDILEGVRCDKEYNDIYISMGQYLLALEKVKEAEEAFLNAEKYATEKGDVVESIALSYYYAGYYPEAIICFKRLEREYPAIMQRKKSKLYYFMAFAYSKVRDEHEMFVCFVKGCYHSPEILLEKLFDEVTEQEQKFLEFGIFVREKILNGELNPDVYLKE